MKILMVTAFAYPHGGGLSSHVKTLKAGLEHRGHGVDVLSFSDVPLVKRYWVRGGSYLRNRREHGAGFYWSQQKRSEILRKTLAEASSRYDLINAQDVMAAAASAATGLPVVLTVHGYLAYEAVSKGSVEPGGIYEKRLLEMEKKAYRLADRLVAVDRRIQAYVKNLSGKEAAAIPNFINAEEFKPDKEDNEKYREELGFSQEDFIFFVPRRLTEKNGVIYPVLAFAAAKEDLPGAKLVYAGAGEEAVRLKKEIGGKKLNGRVLLLGEVPHEQMMKYYTISDAVLIPSVHSAGVEEATSISALEAMGSGSPVIASAVGGLKEIIADGEDGLLVEEKNVRELSRAMTALFRDAELRKRLAGRARRKVEQSFSHLAGAEKFERVYMEALQEKKPLRGAADQNGEARP